MRLQAPVLYLLTNALSVAMQRGFVEDIVVERKYLCNSSKKLTYSVGSQIQCVSRCSMQENCNFMNYKRASAQSSPKRNCEVSSCFYGHIGIYPEPYSRPCLKLCGMSFATWE